jgi:TonB family protein
MESFLIYLIKVNFAIVLFTVFYRLFFSGDTFWQSRRIYLISSILFSLIYPLLFFPALIQESTTVRALAVEYIQLQELVVVAGSPSAFDWSKLIVGLYVVVMLFFIVRVLLQLLSIVRMHLMSDKTIIEGVVVRKVKVEITPFSFFKWIYLNPDLHSKDEIRQILIHEQTHVRQLHSIDVLLVELFRALFWINPSIWILRNDIRLNLEYLADDRVVASGHDSRQYQYHLLQLTCQYTGIELTNKLNFSPLKKRIIMMNQPRSRKSTAFKYLLIIPLSFALVMLSNAETVAEMIFSDNDSPQNVEQSKSTSKETVKSNPVSEIVVVAYQRNTPAPERKEGVVVEIDDEDDVFVVVEQMPTYEGGYEALMKYLTESIRYPVAAHEAGVQGRVICQFVIDVDGKVLNPRVVRSVDENLDAEALRVIGLMPDWNPGKQRGEKVKVRYTLPINFKLQ